MKKQTFLEYFKIISVSLIIVLITAVFSAVQFFTDNYSEISYFIPVTSDLPDYTVIIDAGHGGEDGGAQGITGTCEKDINLSISRRLNDMLSLFGVKVKMTREDDRMLYNEGQENRKKFFDLRNRVDLVNKEATPLLISIHQNKFPLEKYFGLQVYYSKNNDGSVVLANNIQKMATKHLIQGNNRSVKSAGRNIYLLNNLECPAVLVECGFLSNRAEEALLTSEEYQKEISFIILSSIMDYISSDV